MSALAVALIVAGLGLVWYGYVGYPALLAVLGRVRPRPPRRDTPREWPTVTVVIPAHNEEAAIRGTLDGVLGADYPAERRHILVVSDASTDRTTDIVAEYADRGVELLRLERRGGKGAAENAARSRLVGDIVVSTDASVRVHPQAVKLLAASFTDPSVGVASGRDVSVARHAKHSNSGEAGYVGYEMWVRELETRVTGIVGASGCLYASRRHLYMRGVPEALSRDFAAALMAREAGYRSVAVRDAVCYVPRVASLDAEYRRKVRTITRGWQTLFHMRHLLNPFRYGLFAWMLFSHKICRWLAPWAIGLAIVGLMALNLGHWASWAPWVAGVVGLVGLLAWLGWIWPEDRQMPRPLALCAFLVAANTAVVHASIRALRGDRLLTWQPTQRDVGVLDESKTDSGLTTVASSRH